MESKRRHTPELGDVALAERLRRRQGEIERALAHTVAATGPGGVQDLPCRGELNEAFTAITEYNFDCIESGEDVSSPIPSAAIAQARRAAREGLPLDAVLVRLVAGQTLLNEFVFQEASDFTGQSLCGVQALQGAILRRLVAELAEEYKCEKNRLGRLSTGHQSALVERLLAGAPAGDHELGYSLEMWHIGLVLRGGRPMDEARALSESLGTALLAVPREGGLIWAWLGSKQRLSSCLVRDTVVGRNGIKATFVVGEPGEGIDGWRSTHLEARAALGVAMRLSASVICFADVASEAIALQTPDLARSLQALYLAPLEGNRRSASALLQTLRAYFASGRNASSAAAALGVSRRTVETRLRFVEKKVGRSLVTWGADLELALRLKDLDSGQR